MVMRLLEENQTEIFRITRSEALEKVDGFIHDWEFDLEDIRFSPEAGVLEVMFNREMYEEREAEGGWLIKNIKIPIVRCVLRIHNATSYEIIDTQKIGRYPFESVQYDEESQVVHVATVVPLEFRIRVERLEISGNKEDTPIEYRKDWTFNI